MSWLAMPRHAGLGRGSSVHACRHACNLVITMTVQTPALSSVGQSMDEVGMYMCWEAYLSNPERWVVCRMPACAADA